MSKPKVILILDFFEQSDSFNQNSNNFPDFLNFQGLTGIAECPDEFCIGNPEFMEVCKSIEVIFSNNRVIARKPDGTICYCVCK